MLLTTTNVIEGYEITEYKGLVFGEALRGTNVVKDIGAGLKNFFGGRMDGYEETLVQARKEALSELEARAAKLGANAVVGIQFDSTTDQGMLMVMVTGTAVVTK